MPTLIDVTSQAPLTAAYVTIGADATLPNERALTGTSNQITVTDNGAGSTVVLSTPQSIHTGASPTFAGLTLSGMTAGSVLFAGTAGVISQDNANFFFTDASNSLRIGANGTGFLGVGIGVADFSGEQFHVRSNSTTATDTTPVAPLAVLSGAGVYKLSLLNTTYSADVSNGLLFSQDTSGVALIEAGNGTLSTSNKGGHITIDPTNRAITLRPGSGAGLLQLETVNDPTNGTDINALLIFGVTNTDNTTNYANFNIQARASDGVNSAISQYQYLNEMTWTQAGGFTQDLWGIWDSSVAAGGVYAISAYKGLAQTVRLGYAVSGKHYDLQANGKIVQVNPTEISAQADGTLAAASFAATFTKNDANTRSFPVVTIQPVINFGGFNTTTSVTVLQVGTTNTATTGLIDLYLAKFTMTTAAPSNTIAAVTAERITADTGGAVMIQQKSRGTVGSESVALSGDVIGNMQFRSYDAASGGQPFPSTLNAVIRAVATENQDTTHHGAKLEIRTTPIASTTITTRVWIDENGFGIGSTGTTATTAPVAPLHVAHAVTTGYSSYTNVAGTAITPGSIIRNNIDAGSFTGGTIFNNLLAEVQVASATDASRTVRGVQGFVYVPSSDATNLPSYILTGVNGFAQHVGTGTMGTIIGMNAVATHSGSSTATTVQGGLSTATMDGGGATTVAGYTVQATRTASGSVTSLIGLQASISNSGTGTVTAAYGVKVEDLVNSAGTLTDTYGVYVGDVSAGTQTNAAWSVYASDANAKSFFSAEVRLGTRLVPNANDGAALGTTALQFSDLFLAEGGVINWDNGDVTITQTGDILDFAGLTNVEPSADDGCALGAAAKSWSDLFLASGAVVNFANGNATLTHSTGALAFSAVAVTVPVMATTASSSTSVTFTSADYGKVFLWSPGGTATATLPANGAAAGAWFDVLLLTNQTVTISAATADTLITFNDTQADSVAFSTTSAKTGGCIRFISNGSVWVAFNLTNNTMTVAT